MSKIALNSNASGTGVFTISSPNSDTDRTLTLPDESGTILTSASEVGVAGINSSATGTAITIDSSDRVLMPNQPAFQAHIETSLPYSAGVKIFPITSVNVGSHYSTSTGLFTAPVAGVYYFNFQLLDDAGTSHADYSFKLNGTSVVTRIRTVGTAANVHVSSQMNALVSMQANDTIGVYQEASGSGVLYGDTTWRWTNFKGYLIG